MQGEAPLLLKSQLYHLWGNSYEKYYHQKGGSLYGLVLFSVNLQMGLGRNSLTLVMLNFGWIVSWNARRESSAMEAIAAPAPKIEMHCLCGQVATSMTPICNSCVSSLQGKPQ